MLKLLIADNNEDFRLALAAALQSHYQVLYCRTGMEALEILFRETPDVFVLDLMLPELDGVTLLERAVAKGIRPMVLAVTSLSTDYVLDCAERLGIGYLIRKPCDVQAAAARVRDLSRRLKPSAPKQDPQSLVSELLLSLNIATRHKGFAYLREAVVLMTQDPRQSITKELYPAVAKRCGCEKEHVERSIRSALEAAWKRRDPQVWQLYFPDALHRPTNAEFISRLAEALRLTSE